MEQKPAEGAGPSGRGEHETIVPSTGSRSCAYATPTSHLRNGRREVQRLPEKARGAEYGNIDGCWLAWGGTGIATVGWAWVAVLYLPRVVAEAVSAPCARPGRRRGRVRMGPREGACAAHLSEMTCCLVGPSSLRSFLLIPGRPHLALYGRAIRPTWPSLIIQHPPASTGKIHAQANDSRRREGVGSGRWRWGQLSFHIGRQVWMDAWPEWVPNEQRLQPALAILGRAAWPRARTRRPPRPSSDA